MMKKKLLILLALISISLGAWAEQYPDVLRAVGDCTSGGWELGQLTHLYKTDEKCYEGFVKIVGNGELKFLCQDGWGTMWGAESNGTTLSDSEMTRKLVFDEIGSNDNEKKFASSLTAGLYLVKIDVKDADNGKVEFARWTSEKTYEIRSLGHLKAFATCVNKFDPTINAVLKENINGGMDYEIGWWESAENNKMYAGHFDGEGHSVLLNINKGNQENLGLFGVVTSGAVIKNVRVRGTVQGKNFIGGIIGSVRGSTGEVTISNCINDAAISGNKNVAGIVGVNVYAGGYVKTNIQNCRNTGNISGTEESALISGWIGNGTIQNTFASGSIAGQDINKEFARTDGAVSVINNVTITGSPSTVGAVYFDPAHATYELGGDPAQFRLAAILVNNGCPDKNFKLMGDVDFSGHEYMPIGTDEMRYRGHFNGQGHRISHLNYVGGDNNQFGERGFFSVATGGAVIEGITIDATCSFKSNGGKIAAIVGCCNGT